MCYDIVQLTMLLSNIFPNLPTSPIDQLTLIVGILGGILVVYSQFVEAEHRRDLIRLIGALSLAVYTITTGNLIFLLTTVGIALAALTEFIEIYLGIHKHSREDIRAYFKIRK